MTQKRVLIMYWSPEEDELKRSCVRRGGGAMLFRGMFCGGFPNQICSILGQTKEI